MITWKCDRCGQETNELDKTGRWCFNIRALGMTVDLCPDCVEGLRAYLRGEDL